MGNQLKGLHDRLLRDKPKDAVHAEGDCPLCAMESIDNGGITDVQPEGGSMSAEDKTYTEEDLTAAVDKAVAEATSALNAKLVELENSQQQSELDKAVAAAKAEAETQIKELETKLDAAVLEAATEKKAHEDFKASIDAEKTAAEEAAALEARKEERLAEVKEVASFFPQDYLDKNADRWAAMPDEEFAHNVEEWKVIASKSDANPPSGQTAMTASRDDAGQPTSALGFVRELRSELVGKNL